MGRSCLDQNFLLLLPQANSAAGEKQQAEHVVWDQVQARWLPGHEPAKGLQQETAGNWS